MRNMYKHIHTCYDILTTTCTHTASAAAAQEKLDKLRWETEPLDAIRKGIKEMQARLTILEHTYEQTQAAHQAELDKVCTFVWTMYAAFRQHIKPNGTRCVSLFDYDAAYQAERGQMCTFVRLCVWLFGVCAQYSHRLRQLTKPNEAMCYLERIRDSEHSHGVILRSTRGL